MQCPKCDCELSEQTHCQNCDWKDEASTDVTNTPESDDKQDVADDSSVLLPPPSKGDTQAAAPTDQPDELESSPTPSPEKQTTEPEQPTSSGNVEVNKSTLSAHGDLTVIGHIIANLNKTEPEAKVEERALYDFTKKLPTRTVRQYHSPREELDAIVAKLRERRLIFISCSFAEYAFDAAYEAIEELAVASLEQNRMISYEDTSGKNLEFNVQKLLEQKPDVEGESVVLVDALNTLARTFPDSILGHSVRADTIREDLRTNKQFLVVIVDLSYARNNDLSHQNFPYWEIPFLQPFLKEHFPSEHECLETQIMHQREQGVWEKEETNFCQQIIGYYYSEKLLEIVQKGGPDDPEKSAESLLKGSSPVEKTVLYTAAFFQEITPLEFCRVVEVLLTGRTIIVTSPAHSANGSEGLAQAQTELPLSQIWKEEKDTIFTEWLREIYIAKDSIRVVGLSNPALREPLRRLFDKRHRFYVIDQFKALQERGIFFYPSIRLAENTTQIAVEMAGFYPDEFNEGWIVGLITRLRQYFASDQSGAPESEDAMFQFLRNSQPGAALNLALERVSDVFRRMLKLPQLKGMVQSCLEHLIKNSYHEITLLLTRQLQFTQEFDALYWFKQLLHRADKITRPLTYYYLYSYLKRMGSGVYEGLKKIEAWLPPKERELSSYSQFDYYVLQLLIQYCVETVARFNAKHYGEWPSHYPLFAIKDNETAIERVSLLVRWLLHPGIEATLIRLRMGGSQMTLIGALLAEWTFILRAPRDPSPVDTSAPPERSEAQASGTTEDSSRNEFSAAMLCDLLIRQFASRTDQTQRLELLAYWNRLNHDLLKFLGALPYASELRKELSWKRKLVGQLITQFKSAATISRNSPQPARIIIDDPALRKPSSAR